MDTLDEKWILALLIIHLFDWLKSKQISLPSTRLIRIEVVDLLCSIDYEDCVENSVKQLTDSIKINVYK